jgi:hypothetical protein
MSGTYVALVVAFVASGIVEALLSQRLYRAVRARDPDRYEAENAWAERVQEAPSSLIRETVTATRSRLGVLVHRSPYPEVERLRRITLVAVATSVVIFALIVIN